MVDKYSSQIYSFMYQKYTRTLTTLSVIISAYYINAQIPINYYNKAEGLSKEKLKSSLHNIIKDAEVLKYGSGENHTWHGFLHTDSLDDGRVTDRYSELTYYFNGYNSVAGMHIEHSFANSWWGGIKNQAYNDLHHLYPSNASANMSKSNNVMAVVDGSTTTDNGAIKVGRSSSRPGATITAWEPADKYKGDFARTYMYMATCYENMDTLWQSDGLNMLDNNRYPVFEKWAIDLLLNWNELDPVDETERLRNENVYKIQRNRNPFIDYPELASFIWGKDTANVFFTNPEDMASVIFTPYDLEVIDFDYIDRNEPGHIDVILRGRNITDDVHLKYDNGILSSTLDHIEYEKFNSGIEIGFSVISQEEGEFNIPVELNFGDNKSQFNLTGYIFDTVIALDASDIYSSQNTKSFTANWRAKIPVTIDIYRKTDNEQVSIAGFPRENITGIAMDITSLLANTTYYYTISANGIISNEIEVYIPEPEPIFTVKYEELSFTSIPDRCSTYKRIDVTLVGVSDTKTSFSTTEPFELSIDNINWSSSVEIEGLSPYCYVRMGAVDNETFAECELFIKCDKIDNEKIINLKGEINKNKSLFEGFEFASKTGYAEAQVVGDDALWSMKCALVGTLDTDKKNGRSSVRLNKDTNNGIGVLEMISTLKAGIDSLSFYAGSFSSDALGKLIIEYTSDNGISWNKISDLTVTKSWEKYSYYIGINESVRLRFTKDNTTNKRVNIDDIQVSDYAMINSLYDNLIDKESISISGCEVNVSCDEGCYINIYDLQGIKVFDYNTSEKSLKITLDKGAYIIKGRYNSKLAIIR